MRRTIRYEFAAIVLVWGTIIALLTYYKRLACLFPGLGKSTLYRRHFSKQPQIDRTLGNVQLRPHVGNADCAWINLDHKILHVRKL